METIPFAMATLHGDLAAADYLKISRATLYRLKRAGLIPFVRIGGRYHFSPTDLDRAFYHDLKGARP